MIKQLLKIWLGILCSGLIFTWSIYVVIECNSDVVDDEVDRMYQWILFVWTTFGVLFLSAGAVTLFLNCSKKIRDNKWLRILSFFLVPIVISIVDLSSRNNRDEISVMLPIYIPFFISLTAGYFWFAYSERKKSCSNQYSGINSPEVI